VRTSQYVTAMADVQIAERLAVAVGTRRGRAAADQLCEACVDLLSVDAAAISVIFDGSNAGTLGASDAPARVYDEVQFTLGEGPCLDSVASHAPILVADLAEAPTPRWPAYTSAMLAHDIHHVSAVPVVIAGEYVGALDLFRVAPGDLAVEQLAGALVAAELAELPLLDLLAEDEEVAVADPDSDAWAELNQLSRAEVSQATGVVVAQLDVEPVEALVRLRAHAFVSGVGATEVARDILSGRLRLEIDR